MVSESLALVGFDRAERGGTGQKDTHATIKITADSVGIFHFGDPVTIEAGQAVAFTSRTGESHTMTEGTNGQLVADAWVNVPIATNMSVVVTFYQPGTYQITCIPHPSMQTSVIVQ
jgi:plastocyanin